MIRPDGESNELHTPPRCGERGIFGSRRGACRMRRPVATAPDAASKSGPPKRVLFVKTQATELKDNAVFAQRPAEWKL